MGTSYAVLKKVPPLAASQCICEEQLKLEPRPSTQAGLKKKNVQIQGCFIILQNEHKKQKNVQRILIKFLTFSVAFEEISQ